MVHIKAANISQMRCHTFLILILLILMGTTCLFGQEGYLLEDLIFKGNESFTDDELTDQTSLFTLSWFEKTILRKDRFVFSEE